MQDSDHKSKASAASRRNNIYAGSMPVGGGVAVSKEFETQMEQKFEDVYATIETNKESIDQMKQDITHMRNGMNVQLAGA